jgi:hypothetical protein
VTQSPTINTRTLALVAALFLLGVAVGYRFAVTAGRPDIPAANGEEGLPLEKDFLRLQRDENGAAVSFEAAISTYKRPGVEVALIGAVHMADREYFAALNREFKKYDAVLYELVGPRNTRPAPGARSANPFSALQAALPGYLGLAYQLDEVDYSAGNLVHADLSMEDLMAEGQRRGETRFTLLAGVILDIVKMVHRAEHRSQQQGGDISAMADLPALLSDPGRFKRELARALDEYDSETGIEGLTTLWPYLVEMRNAAALKVLKERIEDAGDSKIAIFYGAAHLPDFETALCRDYGFKHTATRWLPAWDLTRPVDKRNPLELLSTILGGIRPRP